MIPYNSTSYPYLAIAQAWGTDYSRVLAYADFLDTGRTSLLVPILPPPVTAEIRRAHERESFRRARAANGSAQ